MLQQQQYFNVDTTVVVPLENRTIASPMSPFNLTSSPKVSTAASEGYNIQNRCEVPWNATATGAFRHFRTGDVSHVAANAFAADTARTRSLVAP